MLQVRYENYNDYFKNNRKFCNIGIDKNNKIIFPSSEKEIKELLNGIDSIRKWLSEQTEIINKEEYNKACIGLERIYNWKTNYWDGEYNNLPKNLLDVCLLPALEYAIENDMPNS